MVGREHYRRQKSLQKAIQGFEIAHRAQTYHAAVKKNDPIAGIKAYVALSEVGGDRRDLSDILPNKKSVKGVEMNYIDNYRVDLINRLNNYLGGILYQIKQIPHEQRFKNELVIRLLDEAKQVIDLCFSSFPEKPWGDLADYCKRTWVLNEQDLIEEYEQNLIEESFGMYRMKKGYWADDPFNSPWGGDSDWVDRAEDGAFGNYNALHHIINKLFQDIPNIIGCGPQMGNEPAQALYDQITMDTLLSGKQVIHITPDNLSLLHKCLSMLFNPDKYSLRSDDDPVKEAAKQVAKKLGILNVLNDTTEALNEVETLQKLISDYLQTIEQVQKSIKSNATERFANEPVQAIKSLLSQRMLDGIGLVEGDLNWNLSRNQSIKLWRQMGMKYHSDKASKRFEYGDTVKRKAAIKALIELYSLLSAEMQDAMKEPGSSAFTKGIHIRQQFRKIYYAHDDDAHKQQTANNVLHESYGEFMLAKALFEDSVDKDGNPGVFSID